VKEIRCPQCGKLLFKAENLGSVIEIQCPRCNTLVRWPAWEAEVSRPGKPGPSENKASSK
jgi:phage FluMu protein Com